MGAVALDPGLGYYVFEYEPGFIRQGIEPAPLSMPLSKGRNPFVFTGLPEMTFKRLPAMLADALPDAFGNALIDAWMAGKGVNKDRITALDRLAYMGKRGMGALEFKPARGAHRSSTTAIELSKLVESARMAVTGDIGSDPHSLAAISQIIQVGTSAGGARAKAAIAWNPETQEIRAGQFDVPQGFEHWLVKFDGMGKDSELGSSQDYGRIEYAYHLMAVAAGITMSPCRLLTENGRAHFMTKRFDREGDEKHHLQTLCAMAHLDFNQRATHDYSQFFHTILELRLGPVAMEQAFRRMVFNVMAANCDDHTKNFSFILKKNGVWELAPAYDVTFAHNPEGYWTNQHLMSVNGMFKGISREDILAVADRFALGNAKRIIGDVADALSQWADFAGTAGVGDQEKDRIKGYHLLF
jgi:serine/threonine-protein kinase HipA